MKKILSLVIAFALVLSAICTLVVSAEGDPYTVEADNDAVDPGATVNIIRDGVTVEKKTMELPELLTDVIKCRNPRCITTTEQELKHVFRLYDAETMEYRCIYCETRAE